MADEFDREQAAGNVGQQTGRPKTLPDGNTLPTTREIGLSSKEIHEARIVRDAEAANPGIIKATLDALVEADEAGLMAEGAKGIGTSAGCG